MDNDQPVTVDGVEADGVNKFVHPGMGIAISVKPELNHGEFEAWAEGLQGFEFRLIPIQLYRIIMTRAALRAGVVLHITDAGKMDKWGSPNHAQWYGAMLSVVWARYSEIDPK